MIALRIDFFCKNHTYSELSAGFKSLCGLGHVTPILLSKSLQWVIELKYLFLRIAMIPYLLHPTTVAATAASLLPIPGYVLGL